MHVETQNNALAEIALALAMAFFSIMILTMVSMGAGSPSGQKSAAAELPPGVALRASNSQPPSDQPAGAGTATREKLLIYYGGRFYDGQMNATDPAAFAGVADVVLAVPPTLPITEAISLQRRLSAENFVVTSLSKEWLSALKEKVK